MISQDIIIRPDSRPLSLWRGRIPATMAGICQQVADDYCLTVEDLRGDSLVRDITEARAEAMWRIRQTGRFSFPVIGRFFHRHHAAVMSSVRNYQARLDETYGAVA